MDRPYAEDATEARGTIPELQVKHANDYAKQHWPEGDSRGRARIAGVLKRDYWSILKGSLQEVVRILTLPSSHVSVGLVFLTPLVLTTAAQVSILDMEQTNVLMPRLQHWKLFENSSVNTGDKTCPDEMAQLDLSIDEVL